jgi:hypothetical protein
MAAAAYFGIPQKEGSIVPAMVWFPYGFVLLLLTQSIVLFFVFALSQFPVLTALYFRLRSRKTMRTSLLLIFGLHLSGVAAAFIGKAVGKVLFR